MFACLPAGEGASGCHGRQRQCPPLQLPLRCRPRRMQRPSGPLLARRDGALLARRHSGRECRRGGLLCAAVARLQPFRGRTLGRSVRQGSPGGQRCCARPLRKRMPILPRFAYVYKFWFPSSGWHILPSCCYSLWASGTSMHRDTCLAGRALIHAIYLHTRLAGYILYRVLLVTY